MAADDIGSARSLPGYTRPTFRCDCCGVVSKITDLNADMLCRSCGEPEEDPESEEPSAAYLRRWESTWSA